MSNAFNSTVIARSRVAELILVSKDLLRDFRRAGGLPSDLHTIRDEGRRAEELNAAQSRARSDSMGATEARKASQRDLVAAHAVAMNVLRAVKLDLQARGEDALVASVQGLLANGVPVARRTRAEGPAGKRRSRATGARADEMHQDILGLVQHKKLHPFLAARGLKAADLRRMKALADRLAPQGGAITLARAGHDTATAEERAAVKRQSERWESIRRMLATLESESLRALLKQARR